MTWTRFRKYFPWLLLCVGLACTYGMKRWALENARHKLMAQFEQQSAELVRQTELRMAMQQQILRGAAGFVGHSTAVDPSELHGYIASLRLHQTLPGLRAIGFAPAFSSQAERAHIKHWQRRLGASYTVWPKSDHPLRSAIVYLEPASPHAAIMLGYDMYADPLRRAAMQAARDRRDCAMTDKIRLRPREIRGAHHGIQLYCPVYRHGQPLATQAQRRKHLAGWVFSPIMLDELLADILARHGRDLHVAIYAGAHATPDQLIAGGHPQTDARDLPAFHQTLAVADKTWQLTVQATPSFMAHLQTLQAELVQATGILISLLLFLYTWTLTRSHAHAAAIADRLTHDLRESEYRWKFALEGQGDGLWDWDVRENRYYYSPQFKRLLGYADTDLENVGDIWEHHLHPDDRAAHREAVARFVSGQTASLDHEYRLRHREGHWIWLRGRRMAVDRAQDGYLLRAIGTIADITARKEAIAKMEENEHLLKLLIEHVPFGVAIFDTTMRHLAVSKRFVDDYAGDNADLIGRNYYEVFPGLPERWREYHRRALAGETFSEDDSRYVTPDGQVEWVRWSLRPWYAGTEIGGLILFTEIITASKLTKLALQKSESRYNALFAENSVAMLLIDPDDGRITDANAQASAFYGWSIDVLRTMNIRDINTLKPEWITPKMLQAMAREKGQFFFRHRCAFGHVRDVEVFSGPIHLDGQTLLLSSIHDISERRQAEKAVEAIEALNTTILDSLNKHIALLDGEGRIISVNRAWKQFAADNGLPQTAQAWVGVNYLAICQTALGTPDAQDAHNALTGIRDILAGRTLQFEMLYRCDAPYEERWFLMRVTRREGERTGAVVAHEDVTARQREDMQRQTAHARMAELSAQLIAAQEKERQHLARELHDEMGQRFSLLKMSLHRLRTLPEGDDPQRLWHTVSEEVAQLIERTRTMSGWLRPPMLDQLGLEASVQQLLKSHFAQSPVNWLFEYAGLPPKLSAQIEITAYRLIQEAITNVVRHAGATRVIVEINGGERGEELELIIRDNGVGFDTRRLDAASRISYGLTGMAERVKLLGGSIEVVSETGKGTRIIALLPLK